MNVGTEKNGQCWNTRKFGFIDDHQFDEQNIYFFSLNALLVLKFIMKYCKNILKISSQLISKRFSFVAIEVICISVDQN